jgi:Holliday junction resolvasome RuvABC endonuclease subunit
MAELALNLFDEPRAKWVAPLLGECVLGIDPSLTGFAICYSVPGKQLVEGRWSSKPATTVRGRMERYERLIRGVLDVVRAQQPGLILIEGYAFAAAGRAQQGHHDRAELGGVLRYRLCGLLRPDARILEVAPSTLKKYATGDGRAPKAFVTSELARRYQRRFTTDDAADAFALCQLGLALTCQLPHPSTKAERLYLAGLRKHFGVTVSP